MTEFVAPVLVIVFFSWLLVTLCFDPLAVEIPPHPNTERLLDEAEEAVGL